MRFRPANISLINRRLYLPRLLLILSSKRQIKTTQRFEDVDRVTPYQFPNCRSSTRDLVPRHDVRESPYTAAINRTVFIVFVPS
jgi:hypothetical protein